jgi:hypothetical protein
MGGEVKENDRGSELNYNVLIGRINIVKIEIYY